MKISTEMLLYKLKIPIIDQWTPKDGGVFSIQHFRFINAGQKSLRPDYLYLGYAADYLPFVSSTLPINGVVIGQDPRLEPLRSSAANLLFLSEDTNLIDAGNALHTVFDFYNDWNSALRRSVINAEGLPSLLNLSYYIFDNPVYLIDESFRTLGYTQQVPADALDKQWASIILDGYSHIDTINAMKEKNELNMLNSHGEPILNVSSSFANPRINANIMSDGEKLGTLIIIEKDTPLCTAHLHMAAHLVDIIRIAMEKDIVYQSTHGSVFRTFIADLLEGRPLKKRNINYQLQLFNWNIKDKYYVLKVRPNKQDLQNDTLNYLSHQLQSIFPDSQYIIHQNHIVLIIRVTAPGSFSTALTTLEQILFTNGLKAGLSSICPDFSEIPDYYSQASAVMELADTYQRQGNLFFYEDFVIEHLLSVVARQVHLSMFLHPAVVELQAYDRKNHTDYLNDLRVYIKNNKNLVDSARERYIHRNTFVYHINKIRQLVDVDLNDEAEKNRLSISFKILDYLALTRTSASASR